MTSELSYHDLSAKVASLENERDTLADSLARSNESLQALVDRTRRDDEQFGAISAVFGGKDARHAPAGDRSIAGLVKQEVSKLTDDLAEFRAKFNDLAVKLTAAERDRDKLRAAIKRAGFSVMQTSGDWSIHDVSARAAFDDEKTGQVICENIDLQAEIERLKREVDAYASSYARSEAARVAAVDAAREGANG